MVGRTCSDGHHLAPVDEGVDDGAVGAVVAFVHTAHHSPLVDDGCLPSWSRIRLSKAVRTGVLVNLAVPVSEVALTSDDIYNKFLFGRQEYSYENPGHRIRLPPP
jgi:hypothetical protein